MSQADQEQKDREILDTYLKRDKEYKDYREQFMTASFNGDQPVKGFGRTEIIKLRELRARLDEAHDDWYRSIGALPKTPSND
jgi:hypothetical protein